MVLKPEKKRGVISRFFNFRGIAFRSGLLFLGGITLVLIISFGYIMVYAMVIMFSQTESYTENVTSLTISRIETIIHPVEEVTQAMARSIETNDRGYEEVLKMSREYVKASPVVFGTCLAFEPYAYNKERYYYAPYFFENEKGSHSRILGSSKYDYFNLPWYKTAKDSVRPGWSEPYFDKGGGNALMCTYSVPFYKISKDSVRKLRGVITMDISLESLEKIVSSVKVFESGFAMLVSKDGTILTSPRPQLVNKNLEDIKETLKNRINNFTIDINVGGDSTRANDSARRGMRTVTTVDGVMKDGKSGTMYDAPVGKTGWKLVVVFSSEELFSDLVNFLKKLGGVVLISILAALFITILIMRRISRPLKKLAFAARQVGQGDFNAPLPRFKSRNEIGQLARSFEAMQEELQNYIRNLEETTIAKEKIESELHVAHDIQIGMLPKVFPSQSECDVFAILKPAKAVGGDLYDFFFTDATHLCFVIGDVSGKSVPASLFMAVTRTLFRAKANNGDPLNVVLESINKELCKDNPNLMFVTFQAAVLDLETGNVELCNAGHSYPFVHQNDNTIRKIKCKPGLPLGIMDDATYQNDCLVLKPGECILMYTDGVTEAINLRESFFMEDKLIRSMLTLPDGTAREIATNLLQDVKEFTQDAEQSDDITLLVVKYRGERNNKSGEDLREMVIRNEISELAGIASIIEELGGRWNIPAKTAMEINLAVEEWVTNIIFYAFNDVGVHPIYIRFSRKTDGIEIIITDDGKAFNPVDRPDPDLERKSAAEREIGGLGIHFIKKIMDDVRYRRDDDRNLLILFKKTPNENLIS